MADHPSYSRIRIALAQFCVAQSLDIEELYGALGIEALKADPESLAHMAGLIDGMAVAVARIREYGLDNWAKDN